MIDVIVGFGGVAAIMGLSYLIAVIQERSERKYNKR